MLRLFRIIDSSDPERKLKRCRDSFQLVVGHLYLGVCDIGGVLPDRACIFRSGSFIAPRSLQLCLSLPAQKTFLGDALLTEFPARTGMQSPGLAGPPDHAGQSVNQQSDRLVVLVGLPLLDVRCNLIPSRFFSVFQLVQIARAADLVFCVPPRNFCHPLRLQQAQVAPFHPRRTLHFAHKGAIRDKGSGGRHAAGPSAETSASPSILSRRPNHRPRIDFLQRSQSFQIFALEQLRL
jgi:hypothetical protein